MRLSSRYFVLASVLQLGLPSCDEAGSSDDPARPDGGARVPPQSSQQDAATASCAPKCDAGSAIGEDGGSAAEGQADAAPPGRDGGSAAEGQTDGAPPSRDAGESGSGDASATDASTASESRIAELAIGRLHACQRLENGVVECWGYNGSGERGDEGTGTTSERERRGVPGLPSKAISIAVGRSHSCAVLDNGKLYCWGDNLNGQLGAPGTEPRKKPVEVVGITGAKAVAAGGFATCVVMADGTARCFGDNIWGQLGSGSSDERIVTTPADVIGLSNAAALDLAGPSTSDHACALLTDRTARCWGNNERFTLGIDLPQLQQPQYSASPIGVRGAEAILAIQTSQNATCALRTGKAIDCWGLNIDSILGDPTIGDAVFAPEPHVVAGLVDVTSFCMGGNHACAVQGGLVSCWGANDWQQLGDGTTNNSATPVKVAGSGIGNVNAVFCGESYTCATLMNGNKQCWGALR
jgi:alpha-tubulin suppressor-like RCC1 family protein